MKLLEDIPEPKIISETVEIRKELDTSICDECGDVAIDNDYGGRCSCSVCERICDECTKKKYIEVEHINTVWEKPAKSIYISGRVQPGSLLVIGSEVMLVVNESSSWDKPGWEVEVVRASLGSTMFGHKKGDNVVYVGDVHARLGTL